jgi:hypothetical protein
MSEYSVAQRRARTVELLNLSEALGWLERAGYPVPCRVAPSAGMWISNDLVEQVTAALLCGGCPARVQCEAYGLAHRTEFGVYGGRTDPERHLARSPRAKADRATVNAARIAATEGSSGTRATQGTVLIHEGAER